MAAQAQPLFTVDNYLVIERQAEDRQEYIDGYIYLMAGESGAHVDISSNLVGTLNSQLRGTPCRVRTKDTKVYMSINCTLRLAEVYDRIVFPEETTDASLEA